METSASSKTMNNPAMHKATKRNKFHAIENPMSEKIMDTQTMRPAASNPKQKFMTPKFVKGCATCAAFLALALIAPRVHAAAASNSNTAIAVAEEQQGKQRSGDRVV